MIFRIKRPLKNSRFYFKTLNWAKKQCLLKMATGYRGCPNLPQWPWKDESGIMVRWECEDSPAKFQLFELVQNLKVYFLSLSTVSVIFKQEQHNGLSLGTFPFLSFTQGQAWGDNCHAWPKKAPGVRGPWRQEKGRGSFLEAQVPEQIQNWILPGRGNESKTMKFLQRIQGNTGGRVRRGWGMQVAIWGSLYSTEENSHE